MLFKLDEMELRQFSKNERCAFFWENSYIQAAHLKNEL